MFGHIETPLQRVKHMKLLRDIQHETHGFTEFIPLSFVHNQAPLFLKNNFPSLKQGPTGNDVIRLYSIARLMLGASFKNIQTSWVKEGTRLSQWLLSCGVNDFGGTLINESISTQAGAKHGQYATPELIRSLIRDAGRQPAQRTANYDIIRLYPQDISPKELINETQNEPLNSIQNHEHQFGSYNQLASNSSLQYKKPTLLRIKN